MRSALIGLSIVLLATSAATASDLKIPRPLAATAWEGNTSSGEMVISVFNMGATDVTVGTVEFVAEDGTVLTPAGNTCTTTLQAGKTCHAWIFPSGVGPILQALVNTSANKQIRATLSISASGSVAGAEIPLS